MYIYAINMYDDEPTITIVEKSYFDEFGCLSDEYPDDDFWNILPKCIHEVAEGTYESEEDEESTKLKLEAAGFVFSQDLFDFIEELGL